MAYCMQCGNEAHRVVPAGDDKPRLVCPSCGYVHYDNPKVICGALVTHKQSDGSAEKVLLCRRAIEPRHGYWTLPAGFMELAETTEQGALRETMEEADAVGENPELYCLYDIPQIGQIYILYKAELKDGKFGAGVESLECALFDEADIPWQDLAFYSTSLTLQHYFADRKTGRFPLHKQVIQRKDTEVN